MKELVIALAIIGGYVLAGGTTYGYSYHQIECNDLPSRTCHHIRNNHAGFNAVFWPLYWPGHIARKVLAP